MLSESRFPQSVGKLFPQSMAVFCMHLEPPTHPTKMQQCVFKCSTNIRTLRYNLSLSLYRYIQAAAACHSHAQVRHYDQGSKAPEMTSHFRSETIILGHWNRNLAQNFEPALAVVVRLAGEVTFSKCCQGAFKHILKHPLQ